MALVFEEITWLPGERKVQNLMKVPEIHNPTAPMLSRGAAYTVARSPLLAIGTLDKEDRLWTTVWGSTPGFAREIPQYKSHIALRVPVDSSYDPVVESLMGINGQGQELRGKMIGGLAIDLETRSRVKLYGRGVAGALGQTEIDEREAAELQLIINIEQSLGNCPKYLNSKHIEPAFSVPSLASSDPILSEEARAIIEQADLFFVSSINGDKDMSTNHRGGSKGFVRVFPFQEGQPTKLVWPEYSGNRFYQTLGRLMQDPRSGMAFPDFDTGDILYVSGNVEILSGSEAADILPHSNLAVCFTAEAARFVKNGLYFRAKSLAPSPYNPSVRKLAVEQSKSLMNSSSIKEATTARLLRYKAITPTIARFTFAFSEDIPEVKASYKAGQWVVLDFDEQLSQGYSHMRDNDPTSLNDDLVRTFTVSSVPPIQPGQEFDITIRKVGRVTDFLFQAGQYKFKKIEAIVRGFGGTFVIEEPAEGKMAFVASGVGITPLMGFGPTIKPGKLDLHWTMQAADIALAQDFLTNCPHLASTTTLYITSLDKIDTNPDAKQNLEASLTELTEQGCTVLRRRLNETDIKGAQGITKWYLCTSSAFRSIILPWIPSKDVHYEDFNF